MRLTLYESSDVRNDTPIVDGVPYLDLYELARFLVGPEPLIIALDGAFQLWCHRVGPVPNCESEAIRRTIKPTLSQTGVITDRIHCHRIAAMKPYALIRSVLLGNR